MKKLFGLGKGLGSLIPVSTDVRPQLQKENVFYVEINKVRANPDQPRRDFDAEGIKELAKSIRKYGILQPLLVTKVEEENARGIGVSYNLVAGERRLRAAREAGLPHVPVIIRDDFDEDRTRLEVAMIENVQRKDLNPIEEAEAYSRFQKEFGLTQNEIAEKVSKSREVVANAVRLLGLPQDMKEALRAEKISRAHARALLAFNDESKQRDIFNQILGGGLSSKDVEGIASVEKARSKPGAKQENKFGELEKNLGRTLGVPVLIQASTAGGKIVVRFANLEELNRVAKTIID